MYVEKIASKKTNTKVQVGELQLTWFGPQSIRHVKITSDKADISFDQLNCTLPLWDLAKLRSHPSLLYQKESTFDLINGHIDLHAPEYPPVSFDNLSAVITTLKQKNSLDLEIHSTLLSAGKQQTGTIDVSGSIFNVFGNNKVSCDLKAILDNFPSYALEFLLPQDKRALRSFLGDTDTIVLEAHFKEGNGPVTCSIQSSNLQTKINGLLTDNILTLQESITAAFTLNDNITTYLTGKINPFFITAFKAQNPIYLRIEKEGFSAPLSPFDFAKMQIGSASLDMGKIRCKNGGTLTMAVSLMKFHFPTGVNEMNIWFTPVDFSLKDGILHSGRMDMLLADSIHLCTWGNVDLNTDKLDMILGITSDALQKSFGIKNLPENYVLQVPIKGTRQNPQINVAAGAAKITALIASNAGGKAGAIIGGVVGAVSGKKDQNVPPPKRPFPWESSQPPRREIPRYCPIGK